MPSSTYDVVIVGGGTAGLVLASRLSEDPALQVAVLEAGDDQLSDPRVLTPGMWPMLANSPADWAFRTTAQHGIGDQELTFPQGHMLGGSGALNSFLFTPTSRATVEAWRKLGNPSWNWEAFQAATKRSYTLHKATGGTDGDGPIQLTVPNPDSLWVKTWIETLQGLGFPQCDPFSGEACGSVAIPESIDPGKKQRSCSANAYLGPARARDNLTVITGAAVTKILLDKTNSGQIAAKGVQYLTKDGEVNTASSQREVIIAAGAINSPRLLELSGIGDAKLLQSLGIDVAVDNPHVGENLQNHVMTGVTFDVRDEVETLDPLLRRDPAAGAAAMQAYAKGTGPLASSNTVASAQMPFPDNGTDDGRQDLKHILSGSNAFGSSKGSNSSSPIKPAFAEAHEAYVHSALSSTSQGTAVYVTGPAYAPFESKDPTFRPPGNHFSVALLLSHPLSRGSVHITSASPENAKGNSGLAINPRYLSHPLDAEVLARHVRYIEQRVGSSQPLASQLKPRKERFADLDAAKEYVRSTAKGANHYTGTCAMMSPELGGVVGETLRVHGTTNLRVCDASIIPIEPSVNAQSTVYAVAEMGAKLIRDSLQ